MKTSTNEQVTESTTKPAKRRCNTRKSEREMKDVLGQHIFRS
jgi:hypothetical protein